MPWAKAVEVSEAVATCCNVPKMVLELVADSTPEAVGLLFVAVPLLISGLMSSPTPLALTM